MIDIIKAKEEFKKYINNYDIKDNKIRVKVAHIERVANTAKIIAKSLKLNKENVELAELIGLLHDIGRFEQVKKYHTFVDKNSINHGEYGVKILFKKGLIRKFIKDDRYDEIIKKAILNHNKAKIDDNLSDLEKIHCRIIRDADKTDIFYVLTTTDKKTVWEKDDLSNDKISDEIYNEYMKDGYIDYTKRQSSVDILVSHFAYVYDINYRQTLEVIKQKEYLDKIYVRFHFKDEETRKKFRKVYEKAKKYIEEKIAEDVK